jgi:hypothetical protein
LTLGALRFGGESPPASGQYVFDFDGINVDSYSYLYPTAASGWTTSSDLILRTPRLVVTIGSAQTMFGFSVSYLDSLLLTPLAASTAQVTFPGPISTSGSLSITKPDGVSLIFENLTSTGRPVCLLLQYHDMWDCYDQRSDGIGFCYTF